MSIVSMKDAMFYGSLAGGVVGQLAFVCSVVTTDDPELCGPVREPPLQAVGAALNFVLPRVLIYMGGGAAVGGALKYVEMTCPQASCAMQRVSTCVRSILKSLEEKQA